MARFYTFTPEALTVVDDNGRLVMSSNKPVVEVCIPVADLHGWLITLEKAIEEESSYPQLFALQSILTFMETAFKLHKKEHAAVVDMLPEEVTAGSDIERYLVQYAQSIAKGGF